MRITKNFKIYLRVLYLILPMGNVTPSTHQARSGTKCPWLNSQQLQKQSRLRRARWRATRNDLRVASEVHQRRKQGLAECKLVDGDWWAVTTPERKGGLAVRSTSQGFAGANVALLLHSRMHRWFASLNFIATRSPLIEFDLGEVALPSQLDVPLKQSPLRVSLSAVASFGPKSEYQRCGTTCRNHCSAPL